MHSIRCSTTWDNRARVDPHQGYMCSWMLEVKRSQAPLGALTLHEAHCIMTPVSMTS